MNHTTKTPVNAPKPTAGSPAAVAANIEYVVSNMVGKPTAEALAAAERILERPYLTVANLAEQIDAATGLPAMLARQAAFEACVDQLYLALPFVEEAMRDDAYKPGAVARRVKSIREALALADQSGGKEGV